MSWGELVPTTVQTCPQQKMLSPRLTEPRWQQVAEKPGWPATCPLQSVSLGEPYQDHGEKGEGSVWVPGGES